MDNFYILHRANGEPFQQKSGYPIWATCLRQISFSLEKMEKQKPQDEMLDGADALCRLTEIVCGLHSPVIGETEVQGQFRQFLQKLGEDHSHFQTMFQKVLSKSKEIREKYLNGTGSQSYGSLVRQLAKGKPIAFVGSGHLVQEILPWVQESEIHIYTRDIKKAQSSLKFPPQVHWHRLSEIPKGNFSVLAMAASIDNENISAVLPKSAELTLDFRQQSSKQLSDVSGKYLSLSDCHHLLARQNEKRLAQKEKALAELNAWRHELTQESRVRPLGWEDLCG